MKLRFIVISLFLDNKFKTILASHVTRGINLVKNYFLCVSLVNLVVVLHEVISNPHCGG